MLPSATDVASQYLVLTKFHIDVKLYSLRYVSILF